MMKDRSLIALVTGANRGIGFETARELARQGVTVLLSARTLATAEQAAAILYAEGLSSVIAIQLDVTHASDRAAVAHQIEKKFGYLDILINDAAIGPREGTLFESRTIDTTIGELKDVFNTNLFSILLLTRDLLYLLLKSDAGRIVNVSSVLGSLTLHSDPTKPLAKRFSYSASKAALNLFTIQLSQELSGTRIKVNSVHPGWAKTAIGTDSAPMTAREAAGSSVAAALLGPDGPTGRFLHLGENIPW
jgi:NAD(P)-dependent dehydrogenase (short-subunit alcohol dehydrogenase family)